MNEVSIHSPFAIATSSLVQLKHSPEGILFLTKKIKKEINKAAEPFCGYSKSMMIMIKLITHLIFIFHDIIHSFCDYLFNQKIPRAELKALFENAEQRSVYFQIW